jgi:eukaryotic-like serine/threonine-protein kinase
VRAAGGVTVVTGAQRVIERTLTGERKPAAPLRPADPRRLGDYTIVGRLGEGGMGTVYLATDPSGTPVALKVVRADLAPDEEFRRRFRSEVNRARQVPPFCTAEILGADPDHDPPYLVCEYVDGPSLADVVGDRGPLTLANLHSVAIGVATALTAIHGAGIIHRDLKPRNVLLAPGTPKVIDFGIARALEATTGHTRTDQMVGTVAYMAPERFGSEPGTALTPAADIFAWGTVVAYAGTGRTPFKADSAPATAARILTQPPDLSGLSGRLKELVELSLEKNPADRPSARELLDLLVTAPQRPAAAASALADQPGLRAAAREAQASTAYDPGRQETALAAPAGLIGYDENTIVTQPVPPPPPRRRGRWLIPAVLGLVLLLGAAAGALMLFGPGRAPGRTTAAVQPTTAADDLIDDPLDRPWLWSASTSDKEKASCAFAGGLSVTRATAGSFRCRGPLDVEPDAMVLDVNVRLATPGSCAGIWFRFKANAGYQVRICQSAVLVGTHKDVEADVYRTFPLATPVAAGGPAARITVRTTETAVTVERDGAVIGTVPLTDPTITTGRLALGIFTEAADPAHVGPYGVTFDHIVVRTA